jgi:NAD(P)-dependent dehydrogenase (short-subunit alcohol dehydrogenase family)
VNYLKAAHPSGGTLSATGTVVKAGSRVGFTEATVTNAAGAVVATATSTLLIFQNGADFMDLGNIGSISGLIGHGGSALYGTTKATVHSLTKSWADEYGPSGVRVNTVASGPILTERNEEFADHVAPVLARIPSRRASTVAEIAAAVVFLAGDEAANIHGAPLSVDGGWAAV